MYYVGDAIKKFTASLQPGEDVAMMRTGSGGGAFQSFTTDHNQINQLAGTLRWRFRSRTGVKSFKPPGGEIVPADDPDTGGDSDSPEDDLINRAAGLGTFGAMEWTINGLAPVPGRKSKAGPYQFRAAIRDSATAATGPASQFVGAPDLTKTKLPLSSLFATSATAKDERIRLATRQFKPGEEAAYSQQVLNPKPNAKLTIQVRLRDEEKRIFQGDETPMPSPRAANGVIRPGSSMKPGEYALQVIVTDSTGPKA